MEVSRNIHIGVFSRTFNVIIAPNGRKLLTRSHGWSDVGTVGCARCTPIWCDLRCPHDRSPGPPEQHTVDHHTTHHSPRILYPGSATFCPPPPHSVPALLAICRQSVQTVVILCSWVPTDSSNRLSQADEAWTGNLVCTTSPLGVMMEVVKSLEAMNFKADNTADVWDRWEARFCNYFKASDLKKEDGGIYRQCASIYGTRLHGYIQDT